MLESFMSSLQNGISYFIFGGFVGFAEIVKGPFRLGIVLYVVVYGFAILRGSTQMGLADMGIRVFKITFIYALATEWALYGRVVYDVAQDVFNNLGSTVFIYIDAAKNNSIAPPVGSTGESAVLALKSASATVSTPKSVWASIDSYATDLLVAGGGLIGQGAAVTAAGAVAGAVPFIGAGVALGGFAIGAGYFVAGLIILILGVMLFGGVMAIAVTATINFAVVLALSPLFIAMYLFDATKPLAESWLRTVVGIVLLPCVLQLALGFSTIFVPKSGWQSLSGWNPVDLAKSCIMLYANYLFVLQVPSLVTGLVGTVAGSLDSSLARKFGDSVEKVLEKAVEKGVEAAVKGGA